MLKGIDISKWQSVGTGDQAEDFVIIKATEGDGYTDPSCDAHYQRAKSQGKLLGVYHFARPDLGNSATAEANWFVSQIKGYIGEAILVLDWEVQTNKTAWAKEFLDRVKQLTGVKPLIYMSASVVNGNDWSSVANADYGLWIAGYPAKYNVKNPPVPTEKDMPFGLGAWKFWAIWQYTSSAGTLDRDIAAMDASAWKKYAAKEGSAPTPVPQPTPVPVKKTNEEIADEVIRGLWGNGEDRVKRLTNAGYDYNAIQAIVNKKMGGGSTPIKVGDSVIVNGQGTGASNGGAGRTKNFTNQRMKVIAINNGRYGCNQYNKDGGITGWWAANQVRKA
jgi:GH25 family lysozyme M1 (1,4-beta-N-acetylmuramidase)